MDLGNRRRLHRHDQNGDDEHVEHRPFAESGDPAMQRAQTGEIMLPFDPSDCEQTEFGAWEHEGKQTQYGKQEILTFAKQGDDAAENGHGVIEQPEFFYMEKWKEYSCAEEGKSDAEQYWYSVVMGFGFGGHDALPQNVGRQARTQDRIKIQPTKRGEI